MSVIRIEGIQELARALLVVGGVIDPNSTQVMPYTSFNQPIGRTEFTDGAKRDLQRNGFEIFDPFVASLSVLKAAGRPFFVIDQDGEFMRLLPRPTQVAINPRALTYHPDRSPQLYIPNSDSKNFEQQKEMVEQYAHEDIKGRMKIGGAEAIIGDAPTHCGLVFAYYDRGIQLHGRNYEYAKVITVTSGLTDAYYAAIGCFRELDGLEVLKVYPHVSYSKVRVAPLLVPARE